jgi:hypothetical protein
MTSLITVLTTLLKCTVETLPEALQSPRNMLRVDALMRKGHLVTNHLDTWNRPVNYCWFTPYAAFQHKVRKGKYRLYIPEYILQYHRYFLMLPYLPCVAESFPGRDIQYFPLECLDYVSQKYCGETTFTYY